jgi:hypothetical protein
MTASGVSIRVAWPACAAPSSAPVNETRDYWMRQDTLGGAVKLRVEEQARSRRSPVRMFKLARPSEAMPPSWLQVDACRRSRPSHLALDCTAARDRDLAHPIGHPSGRFPTTGAA